MPRKRNRYAAVACLACIHTDTQQDHFHSSKCNKQWCLLEPDWFSTAWGTCHLHLCRKVVCLTAGKMVIGCYRMPNVSVHSQKMQKMSVSFVTSIHLSPRTHAHSCHWADFFETWYWRSYENLSRKSNCGYIWTKISGTLHKTPKSILFSYYSCQWQ